MVTHVLRRGARATSAARCSSFLAEQRGGIRRAVLGLTDEQAATRPSASELSLAGLVKHVAETEQGWVRPRPAASRRPCTRDQSNWHESFRLVDGETRRVAARVLGEGRRRDRGVHPLGAEPGRHLPAARTSPGSPEEARLDALAVPAPDQETARHAGHADIIRESLDGRTAFELVALGAGPTGRELRP